MKYIVGLGNPEEKYEGTRHNVGRDIVEAFAKKFKLPLFEENKKINALVTEGKVGKVKVMLILPETYMNKSGNALKKIVTSKKKAGEMIVVYDELDLGVGDIKVSFNKSSGGHRGVESVIKSVGTKEFARLRIGISKKLASGRIKKVIGDEGVQKHVLGKFSPGDA
ncbi:MAG: PTH1 family peptidyl-tRNA hydrolase, partial [Candidatus Paceibacteria bacterium]